MSSQFKLFSACIFTLVFNTSYAESYNFEAVFAASIEQTTTLPDSVIGTATSYDATITRKYTSSSFQLLDGDSNIFSTPLLTLTNTYIGEYLGTGNWFNPGGFRFYGFDYDDKISLKLDFGNSNSLSWESALNLELNGDCFSGCNNWASDWAISNFVGTGIFEGATYSAYYRPFGFSGPPDPAVTGYDVPNFSYVNVYSNNNLSSIRVGLIVNTISPVPEPENYAMFLAGLGLIGLARKFKR